MNELDSLASFLIILAILIGVIGGIYLFGFHYKTGYGEHFGYITASERNGIIFKTGRVYFKTSIRSSQEDKYCVINKNIYKQLESLDSTDYIQIKYESYYSNGVANCEGEKAVITSFKKIKFNNEVNL